MNKLISAAFVRTRLVCLVFVLLLAIGVLAYWSIPKESNPDIPIPTLYVIATLDGVSPQDSERLLVKPLEAELAIISGLDEMKSTAGEGFGSVTLEFLPGFDANRAVTRVQEAVDRAKQGLPDGIDDPVVEEINTALFPILTIMLSGGLTERELNDAAKSLKDLLETRPGILEAEIIGNRDDILEIILDPVALETYNLSFDEVIAQINANNLLVAAGSMEAGAGRLNLKVPGLIEDITDVLSQPVKVSDGTVVKLKEVASVRRAFEDATSIARVNGQPALSIEITKRLGANIISTVASAKEAIDATRDQMPEGLIVTYFQDESSTIQTMLGDLEASVISAVILVFIVVLVVLGTRSALLVGLAIPGAFLFGIAGLWIMDLTMNLVVLFSLILVVGMLVDGAVITTELADRKLQTGMPPAQAYQFAAVRMSLPVIASTGTTLCVFVPLLFWQGIVGEFMKFLPITVMLTLGASILMALVFIPVLGGLFGRKQPRTAKAKASLVAAEIGDPRKLSGFSGWYARVLNQAILRPFTTVLAAAILFVGSLAVYMEFGAGVAFFPSMEPETMQLQVISNDPLSIAAKSEIVSDVEARLSTYSEITDVYASVFNDSRRAADVAGTLRLKLANWQLRRPAEKIGADIREDLARIPGIRANLQIEDGGPAGGKPIRLEILAQEALARDKAVAQVVLEMEKLGGFVDITDSRPLPGVEWRIDVDRARAAEFGANVMLVGQAAQLLTQGITVADYRPDDNNTAVDIRIRYPQTDRDFENLSSLHVQTSNGLVPVANFTQIKPAPRSNRIERIDQRRVMVVEADVAPGRTVDEQVKRLQASLGSVQFESGVEWKIAGEAEEQQEAAIFLISAFIAAVLGMIFVLLLQFNSFAQAAMVMSAIVFSIAGVLLSLVITGQPFGIVMVGIGIIALAGIVVNNNIVLIDTFNDLRRGGVGVREAALRTGAQRLRPVLLTSITTALGLMPMVFALNINFFERSITIGAPSTQLWTQFSISIVGGLIMATLTTLLVTPSMLVYCARGR